VDGADDIRALARSTRRGAEAARRAGPYFSTTKDRASMGRIAAHLEAEAADLEAQADALDRSASKRPPEGV